MQDIQSLSHIIVEFYEKLSSWENAIVEGSGLSLPHMHAIEILGTNGPLKMKELAEKIGITTGTLTVTIDKLEKKGIVSRKSNPADRRSFVIELTQQGKEIQQEHSQYHLQLTAECTADFTESEKEQFFSLIRNFIQHI
ncbi:MAG: MarR family transcriptional regulator [Spirochaetes bacterium]|nr:MarR family transcriptional regulator [Spirochaetota bacterium]